MDVHEVRRIHAVSTSSSSGDQVLYVDGHGYAILVMMRDTNVSTTKKKKKRCSVFGLQTWKTIVVFDSFYNIVTAIVRAGGHN
ncbi:hypothetical protein P3S68_012560 [Capsicum galapagoense]